MSFEILNFEDKLEPSKPGRYKCPICQGDNFTISKEGAYSCWHGCEPKDLREAIAPWANREKQATTAPRARGSTKPRKQSRPAPLPELINLAKLAQPATGSPQPVKRLDPRHGEVEEIVYHYTPDKWKTRTQWIDPTQVKGYSKSFVLWHRDTAGKAIVKSGEGVRIPYRIEEARAAAKATDANALMGAEGEKAVETYRETGIACITLSSFSKDEVALLAQMLKEAGLGLVYHPDNDAAGASKAAKIQAECDRVGVPCLVINPVAICPDLPESGDVVEVLELMDVTEFIKRLEVEIHAGLEARKASQLTLDAEASISDASEEGLDIVKDIENRFANRLRLNRLSGVVELDGHPLRVEEFYLTLRRTLGLKISKQLAIDLVTQLARENEYSPVVEYLEKVSKEYTDTTTTLLDDMASRYFGTSNSLYNTYVRKALISAVARAMFPGCKLDTALVLQGKQGYFKSTFFDTLAANWFDDSLGNTGNKDELLKLRTSWFLEWSELERAFSKRSNGDLKAFMSCRVDNLRVPYGRSIEAFPRHCVLVGTTNEEEFLADPTGDRRFWIVPIQKPIDCKLLAEERDKLWAAAVALYRSGHQWWLTAEEHDVSQELNQPYRVEDPWLQHIKEYIDRLPDSGGVVRVYTKNILEHCLELDKPKQDRATQMRVAAVLKRLGFTKKPDSKGNSSWVQLLPEVSVPLSNAAIGVSANEPNSLLIPTDTFIPEVSVPSNNVAVRVSATQLTPTDTLSPNFTKSSDADAVEQSTQLNISNQALPEDKVSEVSVGIRNEDTVRVPATDTCTDTCTDTSLNEPAPALAEVESSSQMMIELAELIIDKATLLDLTGQWSPTYKHQVWALLPEELKQKCKELMQATEEEVSDRNE